MRLHDELRRTAPAHRHKFGANTPQSAVSDTREKRDYHRTDDQAGVCTLNAGITTQMLRDARTSSERKHARSGGHIAEHADREWHGEPHGFAALPKPTHHHCTAAAQPPSEPPPDGEAAEPTALDLTPRHPRLS